MAAAAMTPAWFESAFRCFNLPSDIFIYDLLQLGNRAVTLPDGGNNESLHHIMTHCGANRPDNPTGMSIFSRAGNRPGLLRHCAESAASAPAHPGTHARSARAIEIPRGFGAAFLRRAAPAERSRSKAPGDRQTSAGNRCSSLTATRGHFQDGECALRIRRWPAALRYSPPD